jgi:3-methyl-2-oxobutanoate hydroxymethyltransferase
MGHVGLTPQSIHQFGTYKERGKTKKEADEIFEDAIVLEQSGAFAVVLEKIPAVLAKKITASLKIPTIGIGAGKYCDGQILVTPDMLALNVDFHPRFVRHYSNLAEEINKAVRNYIADIKKGSFPSAKESY